MDAWESARSSDQDHPRGLSAPKRIALVGFSPLLTGLLEPSLSKRAEVQVADSLEEIDQAVDAVLIANGDPTDSEQAQAIHARKFASRVVQVTPRGEHAVLYELWPRRVRLGDLDTDALVDVLCAPSPDWKRWNRGGR